MEFIPHDYQKRAIDLAVRLPKLGLFLDMGLGKTVITLTAIQELMYNRFEVSRRGYMDGGACQMGPPEGIENIKGFGGRTAEGAGTAGGRRRLCHWT